MWVYLLPLLLAALGLAPGLRGGFVLDDVHAILGNPVVTGELPAAAVFQRTFWGRPLGEPPTAWRPLGTLLFRLEHALFGPSALAFHLVGLLLYLLLTLALVRLARLWLDRRAACLAGCLFAVCPLHVENVASLVGVADTLALLFGVAALLLLRDALRGGLAGPRATAGAALCQLLALLCKESAATLPPVAAALLLAAPGAPADPRRRRLLPAAALAAATGAYLSVRLHLVPLTFHNPIPDDVLAGAGPVTRARFALGLLATYGRLLALPLDLCTGRKYAEVARPEGPAAAELAGAALLLLTLVRTARDLRRRRPPLALCALLSFSVYSSLLFPVPEAMADRFALAPSAFLAPLLGDALARAARGRPARAALVGLLLGAHTALTAAQCRTWRTTLTLLEHGVTACPASVHNHLRYADELSAAGRPAEAAWHYAVAREGRRRFPRPWSHPAADAELDLPAAERLRRLPALLRPGEEPGAYRRELAAFLLRLGRPREARLVVDPAQGPP